MKFALLCAIVLSAATAAAETVIIEYPDHYYVESTGTAEAKSAPSREGSAPPARTVPAPEQESRAPAVAARPVTNFDNDPQPVAPAERRASMEKEIQRLQGLRSELMTPREGETADQAERRLREAEGKLRKINRLSSELLKIAPGQ